ncbi:hypothetical protein Pmar_PMAR010010 [Perkinsus marinus ATCC 50983]|uniref:Uncharacterized protein n=1 Tax=Perkinsus marinus (strain ATCC 50983 / TXsc) TaxID=423536 RepID=C5K5I7_PERM5|nr:hypothetical protein Pmar_PMAR010010 [Perkinsus marinus ATCC 50983]EER20249.1 hypothetical protein Pmar_PMAR010010 [Perkinsus marinus ATCC 50983]|eukprot:XP_002788453.1 hypothetical protein Pmar_PMAR010010 [Perkinsus marinus ATCC 50983]
MLKQQVYVKSTELEFMMHVDGRRHVNMLPCDVCGIVLQCEWDYQQHIGGVDEDTTITSVATVIKIKSCDTMHNSD